MRNADHLKYFGERTYESPYDIKDDHAMALMNRGRSGLNTWRGRVIMHDPIFMNSIRLLIEEIRPNTIIEFGTLSGGLTTYLSDMCHLFGVDTKILSFDIDNLTDRLGTLDECITVEVLDVFHIWKYVTEKHEELLGLDGPIMVIDDIGVNTLELMRALDVYLGQGDYFISCHTSDPQIFKEISLWAEGKYLIDGYLCDLFGRNFIENPNGFFVKNNTYLDEVNV